MFFLRRVLMKISQKTQYKKNIVATKRSNDNKVVQFLILKKSELDKNCFLEYSCCRKTQRTRGHQI